MVNRARDGNGAHPRSRGEHVEVEEIVKYNEGSSPLARGAPRAIISSRL